MIEIFLYREAFKIFDRDRDGYIDMKELKSVTNMLGNMLTKEEVDEFMAEADKVTILFHYSLQWLGILRGSFKTKNRSNFGICPNLR